jgi:hypothetical protein
MEWLDAGLDQWVRWGTRSWWFLVGMVAFGRGMDLFSTWLATPNLVLEGNPLARRLGWRGGILLNAVLSMVFAAWPMVAVSLTTTSLLVAARNLQQGWLMRSMGEWGYRVWFSDRVARASRGSVWFSYLGEAMLTALVGGALLAGAGNRILPFGIGLGILAYALAVGLFTGMALWRAR